MNRSRSFLAAEAIQEYVSVKAWQINEIKKGLAEADAGDFASEEGDTVELLFALHAKWPNRL
jgi:RHH-type transcriptional regulator, rel operon repressor / antitoxin RelB